MLIQQQKLSERMFKFEKITSLLRMTNNQYIKRKQFEKFYEKREL